MDFDMLLKIIIFYTYQVSNEKKLLNLSKNVFLIEWMLYAKL